MTTTLQIRVDQKVKEKARKAFVTAGLDMSSGVKLYLTHVANTGKMPFEMFTYDNILESEKKKIVANMKDAFKNGKRYRSIEEAHRDVLGG